MAKTITYEVVLRVRFRFVGGEIRTASFETQYVSLPPRDPDTKDSMPAPAEVKRLFQEAQTLKKVNVRVPDGAADVVHLFLEWKEGDVTDTLVTLKLLSREGSEETIL